MKSVCYVLAFLAHAVSSMELQQYDNIWISVDTLVAILHAHFHTHESATFTAEQLVAALSQRNHSMLIRTKPAPLSSMGDFAANPSNLYRVRHYQHGKANWIFNIYYKESLSEERARKRTRQSTALSSTSSSVQWFADTA